MGYSLKQCYRLCFALGHIAMFSGEVLNQSSVGSSARKFLMIDIQQIAKDNVKETAAATQPQAKTVKGDMEADGLMDIFTAMEVGENPISKLSKDLSEVSVYALLEQTQQLAMQMKLGARGF